MERITLDNGAVYRVKVEHDADMGYPWDECDGHGEIRTARKPYNYSEATGKRPGEVVIHDDRHTLWLYDFAGAVQTARRDNWGCDACTPEMTRGQRAARDVLTGNPAAPVAYFIGG